jgi:hypothetical protein
VKDENGIVNNYSITEIKIERLYVNAIEQEFVHLKSYDMNRMAALPADKIPIGNCVVRNQETGQIQEFLFLMKQFRVETLKLDMAKDTDPKIYKDYSFLLIMPKNIIADQISSAKTKVMEPVQVGFIIPFALVSLVMMFIVSYFLKRISVEITKPIIELFQKI